MSRLIHKGPNVFLLSHVTRMQEAEVHLHVELGGLLVESFICFHAVLRVPVK